VSSKPSSQVIQNPNGSYVPKTPLPPTASEQKIDPIVVEDKKENAKPKVLPPIEIEKPGPVTPALNE